MEAIFNLEILLNVVGDAIGILRDKNHRNIEALGAIRKAFNHTYDYLRNNHGEYSPNMKLAELWNEASVQVMKVDKNMGEMLGNKSRFWTHPDVYFELNRTMDVPTLNQIVDLMERLMNRIR